MAAPEIFGTNIPVPDQAQLIDLEEPTDEQIWATGLIEDVELPEPPTEINDTETDGVEEVEFDILRAFKDWMPKPLPMSGDTRRILDGEETVTVNSSEGRRHSRHIAEMIDENSKTFNSSTKEGDSEAIKMLAPAELEEDWQDGANCLGVDPDLFFPERGASTREAKEVCRGCLVREQCLEFALQNGEKFGIWGGMSERERRRIRRQRAQIARTIIGA